MGWHMARRKPRPKGYEAGETFMLTDFEMEFLQAQRKKEREEAQKAVFQMKQFEEAQKKQKEKTKISLLDCFALILISSIVGGWIQLWFWQNFLANMVKVPISQ